MSTQITLTLPDETYQRAASLARLTGRDIADVLADTLDISLQPFDVEFVTGQHIVAMPDDELLAVADSQMEATQDRRFSELLYKQQAATLTADEQPELLTLMKIYQIGLLRKSSALKEAVQRGLRHASR